MAIRSKFSIDKKQLLSDIADRISRQILPEVLQDVIDRNTKSIARLFIKHLKQYSPVWRGIRGEWAGQEEYDLQAHLGLTSDEVVDAEEVIYNAIVEGMEITNVRVRGTRSRGKISGAVSVEFNISFSDINDYISELSYESKGGTVFWGDWLVNGGSVDTHTIKFGVTVTNFSRTGRAIMVPSLNFNWDTSYYDGLVRGKSFIVDAITSEDFQNDMNQLITKAVERTITSKRFTI